MALMYRSVRAVCRPVGRLLGTGLGGQGGHEGQVGQVVTSAPCDVLRVTKLEDDMKGIIVFSLNRPEVRNAISFATIDKMREAINEAKFDEHIKVVILRSETPGMFCAGADLKERLSLSDDVYRKWSLSVRRLTSQLADMTQPTLAAVDGPALGGGLELALACDLRVAASNAKLGLPETGLAIIPGAGGTQRLPRLLGPARAKELIFTGVVMDAHKAFDRYRLVDRVVPQTDGHAAYRAACLLAKGILKNTVVDIGDAKLAMSSSTIVNNKLSV